MTIPKILYNGWFCLAIIGAVIAVHYVWGKPPTPKENAFFAKHKRTIIRAMDSFLILVILFVWVSLAYMVISMGNELDADSVAFFAIGATALSGRTGILIGFLSIFWSNLTARKRLILAVVSVLPVGFTILAVLAARFDKPEAIWPMVKMCLGSLVSCWLINGSAIIAGQNITRVAWLLMRKLKLVSGEFPE